MTGGRSSDFLSRGQFSRDQLPPDQHMVRVDLMAIDLVRIDLMTPSRSSLVLPTTPYSTLSDGGYGST